MTITINGTTGISGVDGSAGTPSLQGQDTNTGFFYGTDILGFSTGGSERMRIDASGNLGLGVTPSAWRSVEPAFQIGNSSVSSVSLVAKLNANSYWPTSGTATYISDGYATTYVQNSGQHQWYTAPSGTAGNAITFTQAMTLDASGNLSVVGSVTSTGNAPQVTRYTSGSGTYTTPAGARYLIIEMVGGGGGGGGGGMASWGAGGNGGNTTFGSNTAGLGTGAPTPFSLGGAGGTYTVSGATLIVGVNGSNGGAGSITTLGNAQATANGGQGGSTPYSAGGQGGSYVQSGVAGVTNSGSGGGGGAGGNQSGTLYGGSGGGGGGYMKLLVSSPSATYSYAVGAGGTAGTVGTGSNAQAGGAGAAGMISVTAYF